MMHSRPELHLVLPDVQWHMLSSNVMGQVVVKESACQDDALPSPVSGRWWNLVGGIFEWF